jgi:hypothetical protein
MSITRRDSEEFLEGFDHHDVLSFANYAEPSPLECAYRTLMRDPRYAGHSDRDVDLATRESRYGNADPFVRMVEGDLVLHRIEIYSDRTAASNSAHAWDYTLKVPSVDGVSANVPSAVH